MSAADNTSRRSFFIRGGATLGAGMATVSGAASLAPADSPASGAEHEAIRRLHLAYVAGVEQHGQGALGTHRAYRANALQAQDALALSPDGRRATAAWHVDVKVGNTIEGDSTVAQMARLQGLLSDVHWQSGRLHADYEKVDGRWCIAAMRFERT